MATIYRKTQAGYAEVESRAHRLLPRIRSALIVVDGRRTDEELRRMLPPQADDPFAALVDLGLIEAVGEVPDGTSTLTRPAPLSGFGALPTGTMPFGAPSRPAPLSGPGGLGPRATSAAPLTGPAPFARPAPSVSGLVPLSRPAPLGAAETAGLESLKRETVRALAEQIGPAGDSLAIRIERARTSRELQPLLEQALQLLGNSGR